MLEWDCFRGDIQVASGKNDTMDFCFSLHFLNKRFRKDYMPRLFSLTNWLVLLLRKIYLIIHTVLLITAGVACIKH